MMQSDQEALTRDAQRAFCTYGDMVYRLALVRVRAQADAEDIVQEVFLRYLRSAPEKMDDEYEKAWLIRVTINCTKSLATSVWKSRVDPLPDDYASTPASSLDTDESRAVYDAVMALPDTYRSAIHLFYYEGYRTSEIATLLDTTDGTVRSWLSRARGMLRDVIDIEIEE